MSPENGIDETEAIQRGRRSLHISHAYAVALLGGPKLGLPLLRILNEVYEYEGPWQREIHERFSIMFQVVPDLLHFFLQPNGVERGTDFFCDFVEQSLLSQLPEGELARIWSTA